MHGVVFGEMERFVAEKYGQEQWTALRNKAGLHNRIYLAVNEYPDAEIVALVTSAAEMTGLASGALLESYGEFIAPALIKLYGHLLKPAWRTLDVIGNTERTVHTVVRVKNPGARPPLLKTQRQSEDCVVLITIRPVRCALSRSQSRTDWPSTFTKKLACMRRSACTKGRVLA
jgi:hypothetical protein